LVELWMRLQQDLLLHQPALKLDRLQPSLRAHVTLARKVPQAPVLQVMSPFDWNARSFSLVRSDTGAAHSIYTVVDTWPLLDERPNP
jgi:2'-5' RNA ligase